MKLKNSKKSYEKNTKINQDCILKVNVNPIGAEKNIQIEETNSTWDASHDDISYSSG